VVGGGEYSVVDVTASCEEASFADEVARKSASCEKLSLIEDLIFMEEESCDGVS
jgi:hypothetical protein